MKNVRGSKRCCDKDTSAVYGEQELENPSLATSKKKPYVFSREE